MGEPTDKFGNSCADGMVILREMRKSEGRPFFDLCDFFSRRGEIAQIRLSLIPHLISRLTYKPQLTSSVLQGTG